MKTLENRKLVVGRVKSPVMTGHWTEQGQVEGGVHRALLLEICIPILSAQN